MSFTGNLGVTHGGIFIAHSLGDKNQCMSKKKMFFSTLTLFTMANPPVVRSDRHV
jgi:hypothetical protein